MISKLLAANLQPPLQPPLPPCWVCHSPTVPHNITPSTRHRTLDTVKRCSGEQKSWRECWRDTVSSDYPGHRSLWSVSAIVCTLRMCVFCLVMHTVPPGYLYNKVPGYLYESAIHSFTSTWAFYTVPTGYNPLSSWSATAGSCDCPHTSIKYTLACVSSGLNTCLVCSILYTIYTLQLLNH